MTVLINVIIKSKQNIAGWGCLLLPLDRSRILTILLVEMVIIIIKSMILSLAVSMIMPVIMHGNVNTDVIGGVEMVGLLEQMEVMV